MQDVCNESLLLWDLYTQGVAPDEYPEGQGVRLHPELPLFASPEAYLRHLHRYYRVAAIWCDPYQLHRSITTLQAAGLPIQEFPQTSAHTTLMGQTLFDLLNGRALRVYAVDDVRQQALNTVAVATPRGWRLAKEKASKKIDAIVALAIACVAAIDGKPKAFDAAALEAVLQLNAALTRANPWGEMPSTDDFDDEDC